MILSKNSRAIGFKLVSMEGPPKKSFTLSDTEAFVVIGQQCFPQGAGCVSHDAHRLICLSYLPVLQITKKLAMTHCGPQAYTVLE